MPINLRNALMAGEKKPLYGGLTFTSEEPTTIALVKQGSAPTVTLEQSFDAKKWTPFSGSVTLAANESVFLRAGAAGNTQFAASFSVYNYFTATGRVAASGSIMSLLSQDYESTEMTATYTFSNLFRSCANLTAAPNLPATTLIANCYQNMFYGCTALTTAPALPATTLIANCYRNMFSGCTALTTVPNLPATTLVANCYYSMFYGCTALTTVPNLPATTLAANCYAYMFQGCTALTTAPYLPATTLADYCCRSMFSGCTALTTAPTLPATTLIANCYLNMFEGCTSLTTAPVLPATVAAQNCYSSMFSGCTALTTAPALPATTLAYGCYSSMFSGCTALTTAPTLPATTAAQSCYLSMFSGCTALTTAPTLPATAAAQSCYSSMFRGCTSLVRSGRIAAATSSGDKTMVNMFKGCSALKYIELSDMTTWLSGMTDWVSGVSANGVFVCPAALGTNDTIKRGVTNCPTRWTVVNPVEYIESTGTQWIDTGVVPTAYTRIEASWKQMEASTTQQRLYGVRENGLYYDIFIKNGKWQGRFFSTTSVATATVAAGEVYKLVADAAAGTITVNGVTASTGTTPATTFTGTIPIFARRVDGTVSTSYESKMQLYSLKIYESGVLVRDYIPVRKGTVGYLYDRVSGALFGNAGTGDFVVGQDKS